jgi:hypothetical protein
LRARDAAQSSAAYIAIALLANNFDIKWLWAKSATPKGETRNRTEDTTMYGGADSLISYYSP